MTNYDKSEKILELISSTPGIHFREIMRQTGMKNGVLSYHLGKMEKDGRVKIDRTNRKTNAFPLHFEADNTNIIKLLRRPTSKAIILALLHKEEMLFDEIASGIKKSQSTTYLYLSQLVNDGVITIVFSNKNKVYKLKDAKKLDTLVDLYFPNSLQDMSSNFEDSLNSL